MRLGVLDIGSNTVHLLVVDAHRGAHPTPMQSEKTMLRLAEQINGNGELTEAGITGLVDAINSATAAAERSGCEDVMAFATSAVREATNVVDVLGTIGERTGVDLAVLTGEDEARLTFLAARRWYGWSAGHLLVLDIGGGSLEVAMGIDERPALAESLPLGAGRITRTRFSTDPPKRSEVVATTAWLDEELAELAKKIGELGEPDRVVATSKTFRSLARLTGAPPSSAGPRAPRQLTDTGLRQLIAFISRMSSADLAELEGVGSSRAHQLVAGALVAQATMCALNLNVLDICPWALREGVILRRLDLANGEDQRSAADRPESARLIPQGTLDVNNAQRARWKG